MQRTLAAIIAMTFAAAPAFADGHGGSGDADAGDEIVKGGKVGPNLYGVIGRQAGSSDFNYGDDIVAAGEAGLVWDAASLTEYVADPRAFLRAYLDDSKAKSKMAYKLKKGGEDVAAYLASVAPAPES